MGSSEEQESEDDKSLDEHSDGEEWSESSEAADVKDEMMEQYQETNDVQKKMLIRKSKKFFIGIKKNH